MGPRRERFSSKNFTVKKSEIERLNGARMNEKNSKSSVVKPKSNNLKRKSIAKIIKNEFDYVSSLFDVLDIANLSRGRRNINEEDDDSECLPVLDIPEKKVFKKQASKKGAAQTSSKSKSFPHTVDGLKKELEQLKGTSMTYQKKLRKKGLQSRLQKKNRKGLKKQKLSKQGTKHNAADSGITKQIKPVFNSDGNVVSNKFDFADSELKKENKRKVVTASSETSVNRENKVLKYDNQLKKKNVNQGFANKLGNGLLANSTIKQNGDISKTSKDPHRFEGQKANNDSNTVKIKKEQIDFGNSSQINNEGGKLSSYQGPLFNKDNKMVFSKVVIPEIHSKPKKKTDKDPKKILQKIKENKIKISELEKEDKEKAVILRDKQKWTAALKRASGEKVRDDPELLKKSITKEKNKKMHSQKKWQARIDRVQQEKEERQKKRTENLKARKNEKKKRKMKKAVKKGSYVQL